MEKVTPYWHKNKEWYYYSLEEKKFKLTDKAPKKAIDSYNIYYSNLQKTNYVL